MPFQSEKQRRYLHANHPEIAKRWERDYASGGRIGYDEGGIGTWLKDKLKNIANVPGTNKSILDMMKTELDLYRMLWRLDLTDKEKKKLFKAYRDTNVQSDLLEKHAEMQKFNELYQHELANQPKDYANGGISNHFRKKYSLGEGPVMEETDQTDFLSSLTQEEVDQEPEKYAQLLIGLRTPDFFMGEGANQRAYFRQSDGGSISVPWGFHASSYEQTIDFKNGGILDIDASEEIISDDGNDIELTAYNAAFDDPNDLSTGVKTLFRAKNGGSYAMQGGGPNYLGKQPEVNVPRYWKSSPDHPDTELAYITEPEKQVLIDLNLHGGLEDGKPNTGPNGVISLQGDLGGYSASSSSGGDGHAHPGIASQYSTPKKSTRTRTISEDKYEDWRQKELAKTIATGPGSDWEKYDTDLVDTKGDSVMTPQEKYLAKRNMIKSKYTGTSIQRKNALTNHYNDERAKLEKAMNNKIFQIFGLAFLGKPPTLSSLVSFDPFAEKKLTGLLPEAYALDQLKKQHIGDLTDIKESLLGQVDILNPNEMKSKMGTQISDITNEINDLTKTKEEDDTKGDGPELPEVVPVHEEIDEYEGTYAMSPWDRIKANQAKRAMLVEKGIIQDNPVVDESVTDITMQANKGGLANLFRVKNQ